MKCFSSKSTDGLRLVCRNVTIIELHFKKAFSIRHAKIYIIYNCIWHSKNRREKNSIMNFLSDILTIARKSVQYDPLQFQKNEEGQYWEKELIISLRSIFHLLIFQKNSFETIRINWNLWTVVHHLFQQLICNFHFFEKKVWIISNRIKLCPNITNHGWRGSI